jgi:hypothetical protein
MKLMMTWPCDWCGAMPARAVVIEPAVFTSGRLIKREILAWACSNHDHLSGGHAEPLPANNLRRRKDRDAVQLELDVE